jgi:hypothetical protein
MLGEYLFAAIGPATARTKTTMESAERLVELTQEYAANGILREHAPTLAAIAFLGRLDEIDWLAVVDEVVAASRPPGCGRTLRRAWLRDAPWWFRGAS